MSDAWTSVPTLPSGPSRDRLDPYRAPILRDALHQQIPDAYAAPVFQNNWTNALSGYASVGYLLTPDGWVAICGRALRASGTPTTGEVFFNLPSPLRPSGQLEFEVATTGSAIATGQVDVQADGDVLWIAGSTSAGASYVSFNFSFRPV